MTNDPVMYGELSSWWPLISPPEDYAEEAAYYAMLLREHGVIPIQRVLELGSGGGSNAFHLRQVFEHLTLVDLSPGMLDVSQALNPECDHHLGDMRSIRLGQQFDGVFVHDAICHVTTVEDLRGVIGTAYHHCKPGGVALFAPDFVRETFQETTEHGGHDGDGRSLRYLAWTWDPDPADTTYVTDYAFLLRGDDGRTRVRHDRHIEGLFTTAEWVRVLEDVGFIPRTLSHQHSGASFESVVFVGLKS